jgi:hypothetical protein
MKTNLLLKNLIDVLFILMIAGIIGFLFILAFGVFNTSVGNVTANSYEDFTDLPLQYWIAVAVSFLTYLLMLIALYYLKKSARYFLDNDLLKEQVISNLSKSGVLLIITAISTTISYVLIWLTKLSVGTLSLNYGDNLFVPLFLGIVGLFFKLISNTLANAKLLKEEHDLTI